MPRLAPVFLTLILSLMVAVSARAQTGPDISVTFYYAERFSGATVDLPDVALGARAREYVLREEHRHRHTHAVLLLRGWTECE